MVQAFLSCQDGILALEKPSRSTAPEINSSKLGWINSELDSICLDLDQTSPHVIPQAVREQAFNVEYSRKYRSQCRLVLENGSIVVRYPLEIPPSPPLESKTTHEHRPSSTSSQPASKLLALPVEIRLCIYRNLLISNAMPAICSMPHGSRLLSPEYYETPGYFHPQILSTCRQINSEATLMLYSENIFRREFYWRRTWNRKGKRIPWPRSDSSPISHANLHCISRIRLFRDYDRWFRDDRLKVLREFPSLRELQIHIDLNDLSNGVNLEKLWKDSMRAVHDDRPKLLCLRTRLRLLFDQRYKDWCNSCASRQLDFNLHKVKKRELERWMHSEGLFAGRRLAWKFETEVSEYTGPSCVVGFTADNRCPLNPDQVECYMDECGEKRFHTEPASD